MPDLYIKNVTVFDGTGAPAFMGDVVCADGRLRLGAPDGPCDVIDGAGLSLAPGFIDTHSHGDSCLGSMHNSLSRVSQGITTQLTGNCGDSAAVSSEEMVCEMRSGLTPSPGLDGPEHFAAFGPYLEYARSLPLVENSAFLIGHNNLRRIVMGYDDRRPTPDELARMQALLRDAMRHGALGLSSGLFYTPGAYADIDEMTALCTVVAEYGGVYATHMRGESETVLDSMREAIETARRSGCQLIISHLKVCGRRNHGIAADMLRLIRKARQSGVRVAADQYPYEASATTLLSCIPPWHFTSGNDALVRSLRTPDARRIIRREIEEDAGGFENLVCGCGGFEGVRIAAAPRTPEVLGKSIADIARERGADPFDTMFDLLVQNDGDVQAIYFDIGEPDLMTILSDPTIMVGTDGVAVTPDALCHPRAFGSFTRALGHYGRDRGLLPMPAMIRKMTGLPATVLGLSHKGRIADGFDADLVLFDAAAVCDRATFADPHQVSAGIEAVIIGGEIVYRGGALTGRTPGRLLLRGRV